MPKKVGGLQQLLSEELQDLLDAEKQLVKALPNIAKSVRDEELEQLFRSHLEVTKNQVRRLEEVFQGMEMPARGKPCKAMKGLVEESREMIQEGHEEVLDSALTGSARKVEHYEIAGYESALSLAQQLGMKEAAQKLQETLREEMEADKHFASISKRLVKDSISMMRQSQAQGEQEESKSGSRARRGQSSGNSSRSEARSSSSSRSRSRASTGSSAKRSSGRSSASSGGTSGGSRSRGQAQGGRKGASAHPLIDHEEIQRWAEERGAQPACVRGTGGGEDIGMIRLDFPGYSGEQSLEHISWDDWFQKFDERNLALMVQESTARGQKSNFNKIVSRESAQERPRARSAH